jgi:hypothetical protein
MGKGIIVEHLGEAHYRIGLDIEVGYARNQLFALQTYLAEFAPAYQEATEKKDTARAALTPINDRLTEYLRAGQEASQAAYDAMVAAYEEYRDAVETLPDQAAADDLLEVSNELSGEFAANPDTDSAFLTLAADNDWQAFVGDFLDGPAVQAATDAKNAAISDLVTAQEQFDNEELPEQALTFFKNEYTRLYGEWVTAVQDNSGPERVAALEKAWNDATEAFNVARENLGKLLNNGGLPEGLATILADQEKAYADYHAALADWQSMTLIKAEKEKQALELQSRLIPYTDNDGNPIRQEVNAWCCDFTEDLTVGAPVATIEIPGERDLAVRVRPGYESRETYDPARDGLLQPSWAGSPEQTYWNWALHPGNARWSPNYRLGEILLIDRLAGTCTVQLDQQTNNEKSKARDGAVLDVNNPIKYQIDPDTGEQTAILPGDNVIVDGGITTLVDVPVEYMECNAEVFEVGDRVMVEFQGRDWTAPKVIGFAENPKPCSVDAVLLTANPNGGNLEYLRLATNVPPVPPSTQSATLPRINHTPQRTGGNIDWRSADGKTRLTWDGPPGRSAVYRPAWYAVSFEDNQSDSNLYPVADPAWRWSNFIIDGDNPLDFSRWYTICRRFGPNLWKNGALYAVAPTGQEVIGAAITRQGEGQAALDFLVIVCVPGIPAGTNLPESMMTAAADYRVYSAPTADIDDPAGIDWQEIGGVDIGATYRPLPPHHIAAFSSDGTKFATLCPHLRVRSTDPIKSRVFVAHENDLIIRGSIELGAATLAVTVQPTPNETFLLDYDVPGRPDDIGTYLQLEDFGKDVIVAIDYQGNTEVTVSATAWQKVLRPVSGSGFAVYRCDYEFKGENIGQWESHTNGWPGNIEHTEQNGDTPLFFDLRYNSFLWLSTESVEEKQFVTDYVGDLSNSWAGGTLTLITRVIDGYGAIHYEHFYQFGGSFGSQRTEYDASKEPSGDSVNSIDYIAHSTSYAATTLPWWIAKPNQYQLYWDVPVFPYFYAQAQTSGNVVFYADFIVSQYNRWPGAFWMYANYNGILNPPPAYDYFPPFFFGDYGDTGMVFRAAFATQYDLDQLWLEHLLSQHNPDELPEEGWDGSLTAIQDNLKPICKV